MYKRLQYNELRLRIEEPREKFLGTSYLFAQNCVIILR